MRSPSHSPTQCSQCYRCEWPLNPLDDTVPCDHVDIDFIDHVADMLLMQLLTLAEPHYNSFQIDRSQGLQLKLLIANLDHLIHNNVEQPAPKIDFPIDFFFRISLQNPSQPLSLIFTFLASA